MMKKNLVRAGVSVCLVSALVLGTLTGCGSGEKSDGGSSESAKEIEFWNFFTGPDGDVMQELIDGFNDTDPEYKIKNVTMQSGDLYTKIPTVVNSGEGIPDLTIVDVARIPGFYAQGLLEPMTFVMENAPEIKKENYRDTVWDTGTFDGEQYAIPLDMGVIGVAYNEDLVAKYAPSKDVGLAVVWSV